MKEPAPTLERYLKWAPRLIAENSYSEVRGRATRYPAAEESRVGWSALELPAIALDCCKLLSEISARRQVIDRFKILCNIAVVCCSVSIPARVSAQTNTPSVSIQAGLGPGTARTSSTDYRNDGSGLTFDALAAARIVALSNGTILIAISANIRRGRLRGRLIACLRLTVGVYLGTRSSRQCRFSPVGELKGIKSGS